MKGSVKEFSFFKGKIKIKQPQEHRVSVDLIIFLSKVRGIRRSSKVADLGAGFGFLSIALAKKYGCRVTAIERDDFMVKLLEENIKENSLEELVDIKKLDIRHIDKFFKRHEFDAVITNPPFYPSSYGKGDPYHFETDTTLEDFIKASSYLLRDGGYFNIILPFFRLNELFILMNGYNLPPRFLSIIYPKPEKEARLIVVSSIKNVKGPLAGDRAIFINTQENTYTQEVQALLEGFL